MSEIKNTLKGYGIAILGAIFFALLIRQFLFEVYRVPTEIMSPTLLPGDLIVVSKWTFGYRMPWSEHPFAGGRMPKYGEVVIYSPPQDNENDYIKRVIGRPGDSIEVREGRVIFNGAPLDWVDQGNGCGMEKHPNAQYEVCLGSEPINDIPLTRLKKNEVFLLGDTRSQGVSRSGWGAVPIEAVHAKPLKVWLSINPHPKANESKVRTNRFFREIL